MMSLWLTPQSPLNAAVKLFEKGFYEGISKALKEDGVFVAQTDNPWFQQGHDS